MRPFAYGVFERAACGCAPFQAQSPSCTCVRTRLGSYGTTTGSAIWHGDSLAPARRRTPRAAWALRRGARPWDVRTPPTSRAGSARGARTDPTARGALAAAAAASAPGATA
ncbi:unnamed protein product, partial [Prorocentrum cordatum]